MAEKKSWNRSLDLIKTVAIITVLMTHISASFAVTTLPPKGRKLPESYSQELFLLLRRWAS